MSTQDSHIPEKAGSASYGGSKTHVCSGIVRFANGEYREIEKEIISCKNLYDEIFNSYQLGGFIETYKNNPKTQKKYRTICYEKFNWVMQNSIPNRTNCFNTKKFFGEAVQIMEKTTEDMDKKIQPKTIQLNFPLIK